MVHTVAEDIRQQTAMCLRYIRTEVFRLSKVEMANKIGICRPQYTNYELGKHFPLEETFALMSNSLQMPVTSFFDINIAKEEGEKRLQKLLAEEHDERLWKADACRRLFAVRIFVGARKDEVAKAAAITFSALDRFEAGEDIESLTEYIIKDIARFLKVDEEVFLDEGKFQQFVPAEYQVPEHEWSMLSPLIGSRMRTIRQQKRLTLREVEAVVHLDHTFVSQCEVGTRTIPRNRIQAFADLYEVTVRSLISMDSNSFVNSFMRLPSRKEAREARRVVRFEQIGLTKEARAAQSKEISFCLNMICTAKGIQPKDLANSLGVAHSTVTKWMAGSYPITLATLPQLAKAMQTPVDALLDRNEASKYVSNGCEAYGQPLPAPNAMHMGTDDQDTLAWRMMFLRNKQNMTRKKMSKMLGVPEHQVIDWENETSAPSQLECMAIAGALGIPAHILKSKDAFTVYLAESGMV